MARVEEQRGWVMGIADFLSMLSPLEMSSKAYTMVKITHTLTHSLHIAGERRLPLALYGAQLLLNIAWQPLFFNLKRPDVALVDSAGACVRRGCLQIQTFNDDQVAADSKHTHIICLFGCGLRRVCV